MKIKLQILIVKVPKLLFISLIFFLSRSSYSQGDSDFKTFAEEFIKNVPISKQYFLRNSLEYLMFEDVDKIENRRASDEYDWIKGYIENSIYNTYGTTIICLTTEANEIVSRLKKIPQDKLIFDPDSRFLGYFDENGKMITEDEIVYDYILEQTKLMSENSLIYDTNKKIIGYKDSEGYDVYYVGIDVGAYVCILKFHNDISGKWKFYYYNAGGE